MAFRIHTILESELRREMRKALDPTHPAGGFTAVRGRQQSDEAGPVQATGFMIPGNDNLSPLPPPDVQPPNDLQPLMPRAVWMLEGGDRSDERTDADWRAASNHLIVSEAIARNQQALAGPASPPPAARMSFSDEEYHEGRRVPSPTEIVGELPAPSPAITAAPPCELMSSSSQHGRGPHGPPANIARVRDSINRALSQQAIMPDFPEENPPHRPQPECPSCHDIDGGTKR
jgi:hypothetical protein